MFLPVIFFFLSATLAESLHEGDTCTLTSGNPGICIAVSNCRSVLENLKLGNIPDMVCGYSGFVPIVCCPRNTSVNTTAPPSIESEKGIGEIARQKCAEYSQYVYVLKPAPTLMFGQHLMNVSQCSLAHRAFIIGNHRNAGPTEFPHMAAVGYDLVTGDTGWHCGGTLISENFVLTAAHCAYSSEWGEATWVRVGDPMPNRSDYISSAVDRRVIERIIHPEFKQALLYHDIALLRLENRVPFNSRIRPACLHTEPSMETQFAIATEWGRIDENGFRNLWMDRLRLVDPEACNANWTSGGVNTQLPNGVVGNWSICAAAQDEDACQGDAGGSLVIYSKREYYCMYDVVGVTGFGKLCNGRNPGIYTRVYYYLRWIESTVWGRG